MSFPSASLTRATIAIALLTFISGCASNGPGGPGGPRSGGGGPGRGGEMQPGRMGPQGSSADFNALYRRAIEQQKAGDCAAALPALHTLAHQGHGYDGAQQALGACLIQTATEDDLTAQLEGLIWLRRAAEAGRAEAQGALASLYLDGPPALRDEQEAVFWYVLYRDSLRRGRVGLVPLDPTSDARLAAAFDSEALAQAEQAVATWQPIIWTPPEDIQMDQLRGGARSGNSDDGEQRRRPGRRAI